MANTELRETTFRCPVCEQALLQRYTYGPDDSVAKVMDWNPVGKPTCPARHKFDWSAGGPV
ncbi:hypothetical protein ABIB49_003480 [Arthrobacter sp. UYCu512]|uniref:hypothetical protein n=1 Tax=Arthrobacter sp. UYCu512 TaxID=3156338 RepID=UPI003394905A